MLHITFNHDLYPLIYLFPQRQKQPVANIAQPGLNHALLINPLIAPTNPHLNPLFPLPARLLQPLFGRQNSHDDNPLHTPVLQRVNRRLCRRTRRDDGIYDDGEFWLGLG